MANVTITSLSALSAMTDTDVIPVVDIGTNTTKKITGTNLRNYFLNGEITGNLDGNGFEANNFSLLTATGNLTGGGLYIDGNAVITGNTNIQGTLTYNNTTTITTANLVLGLGNTQTGSNVNGGGMVVGNTNQASFLYSFGTQAWNSNIGISAVGNITGANLLTGGLISSTGNLSSGNIATAGLVTATGNITGGSILTSGLVTAIGNVTGGNINTAGLVVAAGTIASSGDTNGTGFAVGNGAVSNVALGFFPTAGTPAEMAIRDYSTANSIMYFDTTVGSANTGGAFRFRGSNAFTTYATIASTGLTVPSTQTSNTNVNSTIYYNTSTSQLTAGPSMAAFGGISAPFTGNIATANMGTWFQASGNVRLPDYTTVPAGTIFSITNSAGSSTTPITLSVFNASNDFIYYPPQYGNTTRSVSLFFGQWIQLVSRGSGEWDVVASNITEAQKVSAYTFNNVNLALDLMNFRYDGTHTQFSPVSGSFTVAGQTLDMEPGQGPASATFASGTYSSGTWYNLSGVPALTTAGSTSQSFLYATNGTYTRAYRATFIVVSTGNVYITVERLIGPS